jgi:hypothetical protein
MKQVSKFIDLFNIFFLSNSFLSTSHVMDIAPDIVAVKPNYNIWGKSLGSTPAFINLVGHLCSITKIEK